MMGWWEWNQCNYDIKVKVKAGWRILDKDLESNRFDIYSKGWLAIAKLKPLSLFISLF